MDIPIIIFGAKQKGRIALEILQESDAMVYGFLDDDEPVSRSEVRYGHVSVLGKTHDANYLRLLGEKCHPFVALEHSKDALELVLRLGKQQTLRPLNAIHSSVYLAKDSRIGAGNIIYVGSSVGQDAVVHSHCTLMGHNMIGQSVTLHDFVTLAPGALVSAGATIHEGAYIGSGAIIQPGIQIGAYATVAPGAIVEQDVPATRQS